MSKFKTEVDFRNNALILGCFTLIVFSIITAYEQVVSKSLNTFIVIANLVIFVYPIWIFLNVVDTIKFIGEKLILKKKYKSVTIKKIQLIKITLIRFLRMVFLVISANEKKKTFVLYFYVEGEHEKFISLLGKFEYNYKIKKI